MSTFCIVLSVLQVPRFVFAACKEDCRLAIWSCASPANSSRTPFSRALRAVSVANREISAEGRTAHNRARRITLAPMPRPDEPVVAKAELGGPMVSVLQALHNLRVTEGNENPVEPVSDAREG